MVEHSPVRAVASYVSKARQFAGSPVRAARALAGYGWAPAGTGGPGGVAAEGGAASVGVGRGSGMEAAFHEQPSPVSLYLRLSAPGDEGWYMHPPYGHASMRRKI